MAKFIRSKHNWLVVNIEKCTAIRRYSGTSPTSKYFYIKFDGTDHVWDYTSEEERDKEFERIMYLFGYDL